MLLKPMLNLQAQCCLRVDAFQFSGADFASPPQALSLHMSANVLRLTDLNLSVAEASNAH